MTVSWNQKVTKIQINAKSYKRLVSAQVFDPRNKIIFQFNCRNGQNHLWVFVAAAHEHVLRDPRNQTVCQWGPQTRSAPGLEPPPSGPAWLWCFLLHNPWRNSTSRRSKEEAMLFLMRSPDRETVRSLLEVKNPKKLRLSVGTPTRSWIMFSSVFLRLKVLLQHVLKN